MQDMSFTPAEIFAAIVALLSFLYLVSNIIDKVVGYKKTMNLPEEEQNIRIAGLESEIAKINAKLDNDNHRLHTLEQSHRVMLRGMSALLSHGINGNNVKEMEKAKSDLDEFLLNRDL